MSGYPEGVIFNSRDREFREPVGPIRRGEMVRMRLLVSPEMGVREAFLSIIFDKNDTWRQEPMTVAETPTETDNYLVYSCSIPFPETGLYWYGFELVTDSGVLEVGKDEENRAVITEEPARWQQTVYERKYEVPAWLEGGVIYHIFVDRFYHAGEYVTMDGKVTRTDWGGVPEYRPNQDGKIVNNDFFGGNLAGIIEKLPYLQELGVTCLYLSPIFSAYSNHKYDTSDYRKIDPMFGTEKDFRDLCWLAGERGIRIMLDGVFSHTGSDSVYFDRYGRYGTDGAWEDPDSRFRAWYYFHQGEDYESWWGIDTLPRINKENEDYQNFICGENGVARYWLRQGASGWRLDVADELPNRFLSALAAGVKAEKSDSLLLGEVWEDASNKSSYGERKNYFEGDKLDSVMNYPFRTSVIEFVRWGQATAFARSVEQVLENYPPDVVHCLMNMLGTHDTERILTALGGRDLGDSPSRDMAAQEKMNPEQRDRAVRMLKIASAIQMTLPGVPCVYYGDEAGIEGYKDPFNRTCFPWGHEDQNLMNWYQRIIRIREDRPRVYLRGAYRTVAANDGLYAFERYETPDQAGAGCAGSRGDTTLRGGMAVSGGTDLADFADAVDCVNSPAIPTAPGILDAEAVRNGGRVITAANCGSREGTVLLSGTWKDLLTNGRFSGNITVVPGEVLILEKQAENV